MRGYGSPNTRQWARAIQSGSYITENISQKTGNCLYTYNPWYLCPSVLVSTKQQPRSFTPPFIKLSLSFLRKDLYLLGSLFIRNLTCLLNCANILMKIVTVPVGAWVDRFWIFCPYFSHKPCFSELLNLRFFENACNIRAEMSQLAVHEICHVLQLPITRSFYFFTWTAHHLPKPSYRKRDNACARFSSTHTKIGRLAWPLSKDDMHIHEAFHIFK